MSILWPFSLFLHPPPRGPYLLNPNAPGPVLRRASRGHAWLTHIQNWLMGKSPSPRYSASKSVNFPDSHYRDTPPRALGWYFTPLWLTSRYPRHDQKHHSTCGRPCSGIKVRVLGPQTSVADISQCKRQRSPSCSKFIIFIAVLAQYLPSGITCKQYRRRQTRFR